MYVKTVGMGADGVGVRGVRGRDDLERQVWREARRGGNLDAGKRRNRNGRGGYG